MGYRITLHLIQLLLVISATHAGEIDCFHCGDSITDKYINFQGNSYHETCYQDHIQPRCAHCRKLIEKQYITFEAAIFHESCYRDHILEKCAICAEPLEGRYYTDFWENSFHAAHANELPECHTCGRLISEPLTQGGYALGDGRFLCGICNETAVRGDFLLESSLDYVRDLLQSHGINNLPAEIPITLVDRLELKRLASSYSEAMNGFTQHHIQTQNGTTISRESHIYILNHLPLTMFKAVLAHELLHVYLFERDLTLRSDIVEGFCNLGSALVYQDIPSRYADFRLENMQANQDPDYGVGYRKMAALLQQRGWRHLLATLDQIQ